MGKIKWNNRIVVLFGLMVLCSFVLMIRLYNLQIIHGEENLSKVKATTVRTMSIPAQRGNIYDRYGRPLALNKASFRIKFDLSTPVDDLNEQMLRFFRLLDEKNGMYLDDFPMTKEEPFSFTFSSESVAKNWKTDMGLKGEKSNYTATETFEYLKDFFQVSNSLTKSEMRKLVSVRSKIYLQRYKKYNSIVLANDVSLEIITALEEHKSEFPGIYIESDSFRYYPQKSDLSHILGYIGSINEEELSQYEQYGYENSDIVGKLGIEKAYELLLNGKDGKKIIETDVKGQRVKEIQVVPPENGGDVYLTIDSQLQKKTAEAMRKNLKEALFQNMNTGKVTVSQIFQSMIKSNAISITKIMKSEQDQTQYTIKQQVIEKMINFDWNNKEDKEKAKDIVIKLMQNGAITTSQMLLCMEEQKKITLEEETIQKVKEGRISISKILREKIDSDEIGVNEINMDPCTGSAAVVDVNTGEVLSLVTYPSYDNNRLVNEFDNEYYKTLLDDPTTPLINRAVMERKAPGSIFKMLVAIAGLETGTITQNTLIQDKGIYKEAGKPYAKCLIYSKFGATHGLVDVKKAIEVSCNYYFYELAYRFGNAKQNTTLNSINIMNEYMKKFGLDTYSGIEIEEAKPKTASPEAKEKAVKAYNPNATEGQKRWMDGDSIRCAIGQSYNSFSAIHMAKYIATVANGGSRYQMNLVKKTDTAGETVITQPIIEEELKLKQETINAVHEGMRLVTEGSQGTLRNYFKGYPLQVAAKTGTAEEADNRPSHSWFVGFAPYDKPQIAVVVMIPFGEIAAGPATNVAKEIFSQYFGLYNEAEKSFRYETVLSR